MKLKKFASILLALVMMLALATPAYAAKPAKANKPHSQPTISASYTVDKIEGDDSRKPIVEDGAAIHTDGYPEIYIKQANDVFIWVPATDNRDNATIIAQARANDKSLNNVGKKGADTTVVKGNGTATLHDQTLVTVANGILTVLGPISHIGFTENPAPEFPETTPVNATIKIQKYIGSEGVTPTYESFTFQILDAEGNEVGTITTDKQGAGSKTLEVVPGTYTIREVMTDSQAQRFTAEDMTVVITEEEDATYEVAFVNKVTEEYGETSTVFEITKYVNKFGTVGEGFEFGIYANGVTDPIATMTSDSDGKASTKDFYVEPGTYTIKEINQNNDMYEVNNEVVTVTVNDNGSVTYNMDSNGMEQSFFTNYEYGSLNVDTPTVIEKYDELWHTPIYAMSDKETRVSWTPIGGADVDESIIKGWDNTTINGWFTSLMVNKDALAKSAEGVTIGIAYSDKDKNTKCPDIAPVNPWDDPTPATYNLKIVGDKLVVTSTLPDFGFAVYGPNDKVRGNADFGTKGPKHDSAYDSSADGKYVKSWNLPTAVNDEGNFRFFIHYAVGYATSEIINCDSEKIITRECERPYTGGVTVTVTNAAGETVDNLDKLPHGDYKVTVTAKGETLNTQTVTVNPGKETHVTFTDPLYLETKGESVYMCANPNCVLHTPPVEP